MYRIKNINLEENYKKHKNIKINLGQIYILLLSISGFIIYFYSVYKNDYLKLIIPYTILWPISIIFIGISIFRVKNTAAFSLGFFITTLSVGLTITSVFVYSYNIKDYMNTSLFSTNDIKSINTKINLVDTNGTIKVEDKNLFKADFYSNYDNGKYSNYIENNINNIILEQPLLPSGFGSYDKSSDIIFPISQPTSLDIKFNLSSADINLSKMKLLVGSINAKNSRINIIAKELDIDKDITIEINSFLSDIILTISGDTDIVLSNSSNLSQNKFIGFEQDSSNLNIYKFEGSASNKKIMINLVSTLSRINIKYE